MDWKNRFD
jgi:Ca2+-binding EF-hand superfamily protein